MIYFDNTAMSFPKSGWCLTHIPLGLVLRWVRLINFHLVPASVKSCMVAPDGPSVSITAFHNFAFRVNSNSAEKKRTVLVGATNYRRRRSCEDVLQGMIELTFCKNKNF
ncbi:MAG: hypothetical protein GY780_03000 [bacterium]|nr:hypothetical protein [bacterium]